MMDFKLEKMETNRQKKKKNLEIVSSLPSALELKKKKKTSEPAG